MNNRCEALIDAIDRYIAKADSDLADELEAEGRAIPKESVKMESELEESIAAILVSQTDYFMKKIKAQKSVAALMDVFEEIKAGDAYCDEIAVVAAEQLRKYIPKMVVGYGSIIDSGIKITAVSKRTTAWIDSWSGELADLMKLSSHTEIENILKTALENGDSIQTVTRTILESGIRDEYYKARRVAMTEMFRAQNVSQYEAALQLPSVVGKRWRHTGIGQPRPNHELSADSFDEDGIRGINGQVVDKDKPFTLHGADGEMYYPMYPIDPCLPAGEAINCHCIAEDIIDESILGLSVEERQAMRDEAIAKLDDEWEKEVDEKYRALVGLSTTDVKKAIDFIPESDIIKWDEEAHPRDENGRFTGSSGGSSNSSDSSGNSESKGSLPKDSSGRPYSRQTLKLPKKEYGKVMHSINSAYHSRYEGKRSGRIAIGKYSYRFEIRGYNEYNIFSKSKID